MGDYECRPALHHDIERKADSVFGCGVECGRGFIEDEYRGIFQEGARNCKALTFAARQSAPTFSDQGVKAFRFARDDRRALRFFKCCEDVVIGGIRATDADIIGNRACKQHGFLKDDADMAAK